MKVFTRKFSTPGSAPGLVAPQSDDAVKSRIRVMHYTEDSCKEIDADSAEDVFAFIDRPGISWIDVNGLSDVVTLERLRERLGLHPLALEDVLNVGQRPKVDDYEDHAFVVLKQRRLSDGHLRPNRSVCSSATSLS